MAASYLAFAENGRSVIGPRVAPLAEAMMDLYEVGRLLHDSPERPQME